MKPEQQEIFDVSIMRVLEGTAGRIYGLGPLAIQALLTPYGFPQIDIAQINARLSYMADSEIGFVAPVEKGQFNPANATWRITARGINHLRANGF